MRKYKEDKAKNLVSLEKDDTGFVIKQKRFSPEDGSEADSSDEHQTLDGLDLQITEAEDRLSDLRELRSDAEGL